MFKIRLFAAVAAAALSLAGCGGGGQSPAPIAVSQSAARQSVAQASSAAPASMRHVFLSRSRLRQMLSSAASQPNVKYHQGFIEHTGALYLILWGFGAGGDPNNEIPYIESFVQGSEPTSWLNTTTQYYDTVTGSKRYPCLSSSCGNTKAFLAGVWNDNTDPLPANPISSDAETDEANAGRTHFNDWSKQDMFVVVYPSGHWPDGFVETGGGDCAWHGDSWYYNGTAWQAEPYISLPYMSDAGYECGENDVNAGSAGTLDGASIVFGHEIAETITDPVYFGASGWYDVNDEEIADKCAWNGNEFDLSTAYGSFAVQQLWSNKVKSCVSGT